LFQWLYSFFFFKIIKLSFMEYKNLINNLFANSYIKIGPSSTQFILGISGPYLPKNTNNYFKNFQQVSVAVLLYKQL